jgi:predicted HTH domain antitoxin
MDKVTIAVDLPRDLLGALDIPQTQLEARMRELIALELFREGRISSGKGAEILGVSKLEFIQRLSKYNIPYFTESAEELATDVKNLEQLLDARRT